MSKATFWKEYNEAIGAELVDVAMDKAAKDTGYNPLTMKFDAAKEKHYDEIYDKHLISMLDKAGIDGVKLVKKAMSSAKKSSGFDPLKAIKEGLDATNNKINK